MTFSFYDEIEIGNISNYFFWIFMFILIQLIFFFTFWSIIEDFEFDEETKTYHYPCPCGDRFEITIVTMRFLFF